MNNSEWYEKPLVIYGTGSAAINLLEYISYLKPNIIACCDSNSQRWGEKFCGIKIIPPSSIIDIEDCYIIIGSSYIKEIYNYLKDEVGIQSYRIKCMIDASCSPWRFGVHKDLNIWRNFCTPIFFDYTLSKKDSTWQLSGYCAEYDIAINSKVKKNIAIIIPTFNRCDYVERALMYYSTIMDENLNISIYLADASEDEYYNKTEVLVKNYPIVKYHKQFENNFNSWSRYLEILPEIQEDYIGICPDDDYFFKEGLIRSIDILYQDKTILTTSGHLFHFLKDDPNILWPSRCFDQKLRWMSDDPIIRLNNTVEGLYISFAYGVFQKDVYMNILEQNKNILTQEFESPDILEWAYHFLIPLYGKIKVIDLPVMIRECNKESLGAEIYNKGRFSVSLSRDTFHRDYNTILEPMIKKMINYGYENKFAKKIATEVFKKHLMDMMFPDLPEKYFKITNGELDTELLEIGINICHEKLRQQKL